MEKFFLATISCCVVLVTFCAIALSGAACYHFVGSNALVQTKQTVSGCKCKSEGCGCVKKRSGDLGEVLGEAKP